MKTLRTYIAAVVIAATMPACKKDRADGSMLVKLTDAPATYREVNVEITSVEVNLEDKGWMTLSARKGVYNLVSLANNVTAVLADDTKLPAGKVNQVRLMLGTHNSIATDAGSFPLKVPSGIQTGIKINTDTDIQPLKQTEVVLDFDASQSVVEESEGVFSLKPVIKVKSIITH